MKFTAYSINGGHYCDKVKQVLQLSKLEHVIYKLDEDIDSPGFYSQFGQGSTFPQVVINDIQHHDAVQKQLSILRRIN